MKYLSNMFGLGLLKLRFASLSGLTLGLLFAACDDNSEPYIAPEDNEVTITQRMADSIWTRHLTYAFQDAVEVVPTDPEAPYYEDYAQNWLVDGEETRDVEITFKGNSASVEFLDDSKKTQKYVKIKVDGAHVTIVNDSVTEGIADGRARMNYILKGSSTEASVRIYSNKKFMVTLDNANLSNSRGSVINAQKSLEKKRLFLNIANGTTNTIADATEYKDTIAGEDDKAAIFSEGKLIVMGNGILNVTGNYAHAIAADDRIHIHSGVKLNLTCNAKDALHAKDEIVIGGGLIRAFAQKDALQCAELYLRGGRLLAAGHRAVTAPTFDYSGGDFCLVGNTTDHPSAGTCTWDSISAKGYTILLGK